MPLSTATPANIISLLSAASAALMSAKVFGCDCQFYVHQQERGKFEPKFRDGIHLGFDETRNGYRIRTVGTGVIVITRDAKFNETSFANVMELHKVPIRSLVSSLHSATAPVAGMVDETVLDTTTGEPTFISKPDGNGNTDTGLSGTNTNTTSQAPTAGANGSTPDLCYDYYDLTNGTSATGVNDDTIDSNNSVGDSNTNDTHYDSLEPISPHSDGERKYDSDSDTSLAAFFTVFFIVCTCSPHWIYLPLFFASFFALFLFFL